MRAKEPVPAVVVGLDCVTGLQTARILAARGVPVHGVAPQPRHFCCRTRAVRAVHPTGPEEAEIAASLAELGPRLEARAVLYPCTDEAVRAVARHRAELDPWYHVCLPAADVVDLLGDKIRFAEFAESLGLPVPRSRIVRSTADLDVAMAELTFPVIAKPAVRTPLWDRCSPAKVHRIESPAALRALHRRSQAWTDALVVQERIEGPDSELVACNAYFTRTGEAAATFVSRKLRQWPPGAGTGCLGVACREDAVLALTLRLFAAARFHGLGYLEVKRDRRTGQFYLLEANVGRPTGRSALAEAVGVDLLMSMYREALGQPLPEPRQQHSDGARWIYLRQDLRAAFHYWRRGELSATEWLRSLQGIRASAVFSWRDPLPSLADAVGIVGQLATGRRRSEGRDAGTPGRPDAETPGRRDAPRRRDAGTAGRRDNATPGRGGAGEAGRHSGESRNPAPFERREQTGFLLPQE